MDTPNKTNSSSNGALWLIALSLVVIAVCLVALVTRQQNRARETATAPAVEPAPAVVTPASPAMRSSADRKLNRRAPANPPAPEPQAVVAATAPATPPPVESTPAIKPIVSGGLAPLTELATNFATLIKGRVVLEGTPPPENPIPNHSDPQCGKLHPGPATTHFYLVSSNGGLSDVFVFIRSGLERKNFAPPVEPVVLNQKDCFFEPYVLGLMVNQKLLVQNSDPFLHNVHIDPSAEGGNASTARNQAQMGGGPPLAVSFPAPERFLKIRCDVHPWMLAYVCVVDNPFFAVTDAQGNYSISNVPPGNYVLEAYHRKTHGNHGMEQKIAVIEGDTTMANFTIKLPSLNGRVAERQR